VIPLNAIFPWLSVFLKKILILSSYAAFRGLSSGHKSLTWQPRASAMAWRQYRDLVMPLIVWWIVTRCRLQRRPISAADKPFFHISVLISISISNMFIINFIRRYMTILPKYYSIGNRISQIRDKYGLSQKKFADIIGISRSFLSELEAGITKPSMPILLAIEYKYKYRLEWIITGDGSPNVYDADKLPILPVIGKEIFDKTTIIWIKRLINILQGNDTQKSKLIKEILKDESSTKHTLKENLKTTITKQASLHKETCSRHIDSEIQPLVDALIDILESDDTIIKTAITENIKAFKESVNRKLIIDKDVCETDFKTAESTGEKQGGGNG